MSSCKSTIDLLIKNVCVNNQCINSDQLILLLHTKIIETSKSYYEFAKKSIFLCRYEYKHTDTYDKMSKILMKGTDLNKTVNDIFELIIQNYDKNELNINGGSNHSYYLKYIKYKNKYNKINKNNINNCN